MNQSAQFEDIVAQHNGILYKIGRAYTNNSADFDDLYQEMLVQLWQALSSFRAEAKLSTWLYRVCLNTALTYQKKNKRPPHHDAPAAVLERLADEGEVERQQQSEREQQLNQLYQAIYQLPQIDRAIILLHLEKKKYADIAHIMGIKANHVGVKINRIKKTLQQLLQTTTDHA